MTVTQRRLLVCRNPWWVEVGEKVCRYFDVVLRLFPGIIATFKCILEGRFEI
jgi:hypothetical protein